jgi:16S rRNA (guanine527-N7)-methyltransferase
LSVEAEHIAALCAALALPVNTGQVAQLQRYLDLLQRWNSTYNLTAVRERDAMLTQHLADCLALVPALQRVGPRRVLDVGSGGGLPGVVVAIFMPGTDVTSVDAVAKKMAFVRQVAGALQLSNLHAVHSRIEALRSAPFDLITSRAFASLADFVTLTATHLTSDGVWVAMKGKTPDDELAALPSGVDVFHVEPLQVPGLDARRCLVWMRQRKTE